MDKTLILNSLQSILDELDTYSDGSDIDDLNAEFEDAIFALEEAEDDEWQEALDDVRADLLDLCGEYRKHDIDIDLIARIEALVK